MAKFETGKSYATKSVCDQECVFEFLILRRTAKSVWIEVHGEVTRRSVGINANGIEFINPLGKYSMSPVLTAVQINEPKEEKEIDYREDTVGFKRFLFNEVDFVEQTNDALAVYTRDNKKYLFRVSQVVMFKRHGIEIR